MYLKHLYIENNGPIRQASLELPFAPEGTPTPLVLVGSNGSGKTNLLSIIADALFEAAHRYYTDVTPGATPVQHSWFRVIGPATTSYGATGSASILQFEHEGTNFLFRAIGGRPSAKELSARLPEPLKSAANWQDTSDALKDFPIPSEVVRTIFSTGAYVYFSANRHEVPSWLNRDSVPRDAFDVTPRYVTILRKPIYVERSLDLFTQWVLSIILDSQFLRTQPKNARTLSALAALQVLRTCIKYILDDDDVHLVWRGRHEAAKLGIGKGEALRIPTLDSLSAGQSTLLSIFGTILRYGDTPMSHGALRTNDIIGICLVDEIDAHMHVDLQRKALPLLIKMFPKVQFILSSHSPLFALGMEKEFGDAGVSIVELPSATPIPAEAYTEFGRALEALRETKAFADAIAKVAEQPGKLLVLLEGETDPEYLSTAARLLNKASLLETVEFLWVGAKDPRSGQGFHTGKDALNQTVAFLRAKPQFVKRRIIALYDHDAKKADEDYDLVHVRSMPENPDGRAKAGIENLLPYEAIPDNMYKKKEKVKPDGGKAVTETLDKARLCAYVCKERALPSDFELFERVLDDIEALAKKAPSGEVVAIEEPAL